MTDDEFCSCHCNPCQCPDWCPLCGDIIEEGEGEVRTIDLDPGDPETGPQPDIGEYLVHRQCPKKRTS